MTRPAGVTASAVVSFIGSVLALLFSAMFVVVASTQPEVMENMRAAGYFLAVIAAALGALGIVTAVGLLRLRPWARSTILVFAGIMAVFSFMAGAAMAIMPMPPTPELNASAAAALRRILLVVYAVPFVIAVWWLIQFNRPATKAAFMTAVAGDPPQRPAAISLIGWFNIVGGAFCIGAAAAQTPAFAAGVVLTGWSAALFYVFVGAVNAYLGWHLLKLDERARILTIWWFVMTIVHTAFLALTPSARARMRELQDTMMGQQGAPMPPMDMTNFTVGAMAISALILVAAIWPLISLKAVFLNHDSD